MTFPLPNAFIENMRQQLGSELPAFLGAYDQPYRRALRKNPLKPLDIRSDDLCSNVLWEPEGIEIMPDSRLGAMPLHEAGAYYLQEPSAMLPAAVLDPRPGETVLDLCAAPGGKTTQLAGRMNGQGLLIANEPIPKRAQILSRNVERMGIPNALVISAYPDQLAKRWPGGFDAVLVDAPCSGEGMFRRHPETRTEWTADSPAGCAKRQLEILEAAAVMVRPGGRMVYATCTMNATENENNVSSFLSAHPEFSLVPFSLPGINAPEGYYTCYPHRISGEGQFAALLKKAGDVSASLPPDVSLPKPDKQSAALLKSFSPDAPAPTAMLGDTLIALPGFPDVRGLKVLRAGLHLGHVKGKIFEPDHAWAVSACAPMFPRFELTEAQALAYQAGETIPVSDEIKGWLLPTLSGLPLGWGKASGGIIKNHYPKGLRRTITDFSGEAE